MTLQGVQVYGNTSLAGTAAGGGGGGIYVKSGSVTLTDVTIDGKNKANEGGGMYVKGGTVKMSGGGISSNTARFTGSNGAGGLALGGGGGLYVAGGTVTLTGVSINKNLANFDGGGVFNSAGTLTLNNNINIGSNHANNQGGGMYLAATSLMTDFNGVTVSGNTAADFTKAPLVGAGIYQQTNAPVNPNPPKPPNLNDPDDGGAPTVGP